MENVKQQITAFKVSLLILKVLLGSPHTPTPPPLRASLQGPCNRGAEGGTPHFFVRCKFIFKTNIISHKFRSKTAILSNQEGMNFNFSSTAPTMVVPLNVLRFCAPSLLKSLRGHCFANCKDRLSWQAYEGKFWWEFFWFRNLKYEEFVNET